MDGKVAICLLIFRWGGGGGGAGEGGAIMKALL